MSIIDDLFTIQAKVKGDKDLDYISIAIEEAITEINELRGSVNGLTRVVKMYMFGTDLDDLG